jgi:hypothetical protein
VIPLLLEAVDKSEFPPTLIFTSATAGLRGSANCSSFATGKFALRALYQSLAREFGPKGIHVAHAIIDGVIDIERTKHYKFDHPDAKISPDAVSHIVLLVQMPCLRQVTDGICLKCRSQIPTGTYTPSLELLSRMNSILDPILRSGEAAMSKYHIHTQRTIGLLVGMKLLPLVGVL